MAWRKQSRFCPAFAQENFQYQVLFWFAGRVACQVHTILQVKAKAKQARSVRAKSARALLTTAPMLASAIPLRWQQ